MTTMAVDAPTGTRRHGPSSFVPKHMMAVTGVLFVTFVAVHLFGNLKACAGADTFNHYATWLREVGYPLLPKRSVLRTLRIALTDSLLLHVSAALTLRLRGRRGRGAHWRGLYRSRTRAAVFILPGGILILVFVLVHISNLTVGGPLASALFRYPDPEIHTYANPVASFSRPWVAIFYMVVMLVIGFHIEHDWRILSQDLGVTGRRFRQIWVATGGLLALTVMLGNAMIPLLVSLGVIT